MKVRFDASGVHLFDRATGWNILLDEFELPSPIYSLSPRQVSIALTNRCDLKCEFCYAPKNRAELDYGTLTRWLIDLDKNGTLGVGFGGGEPTIYRHFIDLCNFTFQETNLAITFTTHGHHLNSETLKKIEGKVHFIRLSMDGVNETYEQVRKRSFQSFLNRLSDVRGICPFGINFVVNDATYCQLEAAADVAENFGASELLLLPQRSTKKVEMISDDAEKYLRQFICSYSGPLKLSIGDNKIKGISTCNPFAVERDEIFDYAHINAFGELKRSSFSSEGIAIEKDGILSAITKIITI